MGNAILNIILITIQLAIGLGIWLLIRWMEKLPDAVHQKSIKVFESGLNKELESFKAGLTKEIEMIKINESQLYIHKSEEFLNLIEFIVKHMLDKTYMEKLEKDPKVQQEFNSKMLTLGTKLFFFASDETVKKYVEWRNMGQEAVSPNFDGKKLVILLAELMVLIRRDLGYKDTICTKDDFLYIMLNDWDKYKGQY